MSYFYILPVIANVFFIFTFNRYLTLTKKSHSQSVWILFYTYLVGSFSYLLIFYGYDFQSYSILKGFPVATTLQPSFVLSNIQFFISLSIFFFTDIVLGRISKKIVLLHAFLLVLSIGFKMYTSLLTILIVSVGYIYWSYKKKKIEYIFYLFALGSDFPDFILHFLSARQLLCKGFTFCIVSTSHTTCTHRITKSFL